MKKQILKTLLCMLLVSAFVMCSAACSGDTEKPDDGNKDPGNTENPDNGNNNNAHTHKEEVIPATTATCTSPAMSEGKKCSECGEIIVAPTETAPALGHDTVSHPAKPATCTEIGWDAYETCTRCDHSTQKKIPYAHEFEKLANGAEKCKKCGEIWLPEIVPNRG